MWQLAPGQVSGRAWNVPSLQILATDGNTYYEIVGLGGDAFQVEVSGDPESPYGPFYTADILGQPPVFVTNPSWVNLDGGDPAPGDTLQALSGIYLFDVDGGVPEVGYTWALLLTTDDSETHVVTSDDITDGLGLIQHLVNAYGSEDSTEVEVIAPTAYVEQGVYLDGSTNYMTKSGGFTGVTNGKTALIFISGTLDTGADSYMVGMTSSSSGTALTFFGAYGTSTIQSSVYDTGGSEGVSLNSGGTNAPSGVRRAILLAIDADGTSRLMLKSGTGAWTQVASDASGGGNNFKWAADYTLFAQYWNQGSKWEGNVYVYEAWFNIAMPDVTDSAVQNLFVESSGVTKDPALATAAYGTPALQLYGDSTTFPANRGSGGSLALFGTLVDA